MNSKQSKNKSSSLYATNGSIIKEYIKSIEEQTLNNNEISEKRQANASKYGYISCLPDGFFSDTKNRIDVYMPDSADLSISQNGGFSLFFWALLKKCSNGVHRFIVKKGSSDDLTPSVGLLPNGTNLFVKVFTSKHRVETLLSSKKIDYERMYNVTVTFSIDFVNDLTDISLYLDGLLDSQITVPGEPIHNQGSIFLGKSDNLTHGFYGTVADVLLIPRTIQDSELITIIKGCINNLNTYKQFRSYSVFERKFEHDILVAKYSQYTGIPMHLIENMNMTNDELKEIVKQYDNNIQSNIDEENSSNETKKQQNEESKTIENLTKLLEQEKESNLSINVKKIFINAKFLYTVFYLVAQQQDELEIRRIMIVLEILEETLHIKISQENFVSLAKVLGAFIDSPAPNSLKMYIFFKGVRSYMVKLFSDLSTGNTGGGGTGGNTGNMSSSNVNRYNNLNTKSVNSIELHENLLLSTQNFRNYIDEDFEKDLAKSSFTIRSLYNRVKSGRPTTGKIGDITKGNEEDVVNHHMDDVGGVKIEEEKEDEIFDKSMENNNVKKVEEECEKCEDTEIDNKEVIKGDGNINNNVNPENNENKSNEGENAENKSNKGENVENAENQFNKERENINNNNTENKSDKSNKGVENQNQKNNSNNKEESDNTNHQVYEFKKSDKIEINNDKFNQESSNMEYIERERESNSNNNTNNINNSAKPQDKEPEEDIAIADSDRVIVSSNNNNNKSSLNVMNIIEPKFPEDWNQGSFEIVINRCYDCHKHKTTTRHCEYFYVDKFNEIGDQIKLAFPNSRIVGNYDKLEYYGSFDVYLRGVGSKQDEYGRFFLFSKRYKKSFPNSTDICDKLIALIMLYGSSLNLEAAQNQYMKAYQGLFKPSTKLHGFPVDLSDEGTQHREDLENAKTKPVSYLLIYLILILLN